MAEENKTEKKYKIFIVDDDKFLLNMYVMKFTKEGMDAEAISDPAEALEKIRAGATPDIILSDMVMPGMDGVEFLSKIKSEKLLPNATLIILSNQGQQNDIDRAKDLGVDGYIVKATTIPSEVIRETLRIAKEKENGK